MLGCKQQRHPKLFYSLIDLDGRIRPDNPLRRIHDIIDFSFVRPQVEHFYGTDRKYETLCFVFFFRNTFIQTDCNFLFIIWLYQDPFCTARDNTLLISAIRRKNEF